MVSDRRRFGDRGEDELVRAVGAAASAGIDLIQVRERDLEGRALTQLVARCVEAVRRTRARVLVNDRIDVALAAGAHGVHLRGDSMPAPRLRGLVPQGFLVGRSVHGVEEAVRVSGDGGLDYLLYGTVFSTASKPGHPPAGADAVAAVSASTLLPVLAIGGVTLDTVGRLADTGAAGFAAIGLFADAAPDKLPDIIAQAARAFQGNS
jgi:thiamine-phosphate pyrophosphorylase